MKRLAILTTLAALAGNAGAEEETLEEVINASPFFQAVKKPGHEGVHGRVVVRAVDIRVDLRAGHPVG